MDVNMNRAYLASDVYTTYTFPTSPDFIPPQFAKESLNGGAELSCSLSVFGVFAIIPPVATARTFPPKYRISAVPKSAVPAEKSNVAFLPPVMLSVPVPDVMEERNANRNFGVPSFAEAFSAVYSSLALPSRVTVESFATLTVGIVLCGMKSVCMNPESISQTNSTS